jgi:hypothetical protein
MEEFFLENWWLLKWSRFYPGFRSSIIRLQFSP